MNTSMTLYFQKEGSNHDVTIVLFSRTYYKASSIDEFPPYMKECLLEDYKGRFYEDFYRLDRTDVTVLRGWIYVGNHTSFNLSHTLGHDGHIFKGYGRFWIQKRENVMKT